jgi:hypothetical protein
MKKIIVNELVKFRSLGDIAKRNFANRVKLNQPKPKPDGNGGNYWTIAVSAIAKAYKENSRQIIKDKIDEFEEKLKKTKNAGTKAQFKSNIDILRTYENFDLKRWPPVGKIKFFRSYRIVLSIKDLQIEVGPSHVFWLTNGETKEVGAMWIVAKKNGYKMAELGIFTEALYRYLKTQYGKEYGLNPKYCLAVDVVSNYEVNYYQLATNQFPFLLSKTIDDIKKLM